jgi:hypothetical protein
MIYHNGLSTPYPDFALLQDSSGGTRLGGKSVSIGCSDNPNIVLARSGSTDQLGFFGATPVSKQTVSAAATDAATTQTLVNSLRTALINLGLVS